MGYGLLAGQVVAAEGSHDAGRVMTDTPKVLFGHHPEALKIPTILPEYDRQARICATQGTAYSR